MLVAEPTGGRRTPSLRRTARLALGAFVAFMLVGNLLILSLSAFAAWRWAPPSVGVPVDGVANLSMIDAQVWRGAAPSLTGYRSLAAAGVSTVVDLRAEPYAGDLDPQIEALGIDVVHLPIRDGQIPSDQQVAQFLAVVDRGGGTVFVHCGAGVGRTGAMSAAYLVATGQASGVEAMRRNLAIGPPSLEQILFARGLGDSDRPNGVAVAVSRVLDAPRRLWSRLG